jgi:transposase InsO family protein
MRSADTLRWPVRSTYSAQSLGLAHLTEAIVRLATRYGRYGYRRARRLLLDEGWQVSVKRVYRIWRREGLKVPSKQPKRRRLWLNDGSCVRSCRRHASSMTARAARSRVVV